MKEIGDLTGRERAAQNQGEREKGIYVRVERVRQVRVREERGECPRCTPSEREKEQEGRSRDGVRS